MKSKIEKRKFFKLTFKKSYEKRQGMKYAIYDSNEFHWSVDENEELKVKRKHDNQEVVLSINVNDVETVRPLEL